MATATTLLSRIVSITKGPSKWDLMLALGDGKEVGFAAGEMRVYLVTFTGMDKVPDKDSKDDEWMIRGIINRDFDPQSSASIKESMTLNVRRFQCRYSARTHKGLFSILMPRRVLLPKEPSPQPFALQPHGTAGYGPSILNKEGWQYVGDEGDCYAYETYDDTLPEPVWGYKGS